MFVFINFPHLPVTYYLLCWAVLFCVADWLEPYSCASTSLYLAYLFLHVLLQSSSLSHLLAIWMYRGSNWWASWLNGLHFCQSLSDLVTHYHNSRCYCRGVFCQRAVPVWSNKLVTLVSMENKSSRALILHEAQSYSRTFDESRLWCTNLWLFCDSPQSWCRYDWGVYCCSWHFIWGTHLWLC